MDPLASTTQLFAYMGLGSAGTGDAARGALVLRAASGLVRDHCGWHVAPLEQATTFTLDGRGTRMLTLPTLFLADVNAVQVDGDTVDATEYTWAPRGQLSRGAGWPRGLGNVTVDVDHGYTETPDGPLAVVLSIAALMYENPVSVAAKTTGGVSAQYGVNLTAVQLAMLAKYTLS